MSTPGIGNNSGYTSDEKREAEEKAERARKFIYIIGELNRAAADKQDIGNREKEVKTNLRAKGVPPKALAIARKVKADPKGLDAYNIAHDVIHSGLGSEELEQLDDLKAERREVSLREKDLRGAAVEAGINLQAMGVIRQMQNLDPIEREEMFDALVDYPKWLKFW